MSEYTKEQEAEALSRVERNIYGTRDIDILYAMAKRTAEADSALDALEDKYAALRHSNDALKARVAEFEAKAAPPPVVVTREMVEALLNFVQFETVRDRQRLVVALRKMLEVGT